MTLSPPRVTVSADQFPPPEMSGRPTHCRSCYAKLYGDDAMSRHEYNSRQRWAPCYREYCLGCADTTGLEVLRDGQWVPIAQEAA
jgi:hypothetical protein